MLATRPALLRHVLMSKPDTPTHLSELQMVLILSLLGGFGPFSIDMYLPAMPAIARDFDVTTATVQHSLSAFLVGFGIAPLIFGPLSDRFGRKPVLVSALAIYCLSSVCCALTTTMDNFLALRILQGIGGGGGPVLSRAIVRDLYGPANSARILSLIQAIVVMAPIIAPILGGYLLLWFGWQSIFWLLVCYGALCVATMILSVKETNMHRSTRGVGHAFRGYAHVLRDKRYIGYVLTSGFAFGSLFAFVAASPFVIIELFGIAPQHFGYLFGISALALSVGAGLNSHWVGRLGFHTMLVIGSSVMAFAGLLIYAVAHFEIGGLFGLFTPICCALAAVTMIAPNAAVGAMENHPQRAGAASALLSALQFGFAALGGWLVGWLHDGSAMPLATVMVAGGILSFASQRWLLAD